MSSNQSRAKNTVKQITRKNNSISKRTAKMMENLENGCFDKFYSQALENEKESLQLALLCRELPTCTGHPAAYTDTEEIALQEFPVEMGFSDDGWFVLRMPRLLPVKEKSKVRISFFRAVLYPALSRYFATSPSVRYDPCAIIYRHVYDRKIPETQYRDHDNIEVNFVTDTLAMFVMTDDAAMRCTHLYCSAAGKANRTEVYVIPIDDLSDFVKQLDYIPEEGLKLHDLPPKST